MRDHIIQGPRNKSGETRELESLIQDILKHQANGKQIVVSYNANGDMIIQAGRKEPYNLTDILQHRPDWEQFEFTDPDRARYLAFLSQPSTKYPLDPLLNEDAIQNQFPGLEVEELNAIRNYTGEFYTAINYLLRSNGTQKFPTDPDEVGGEFYKALTKFAEKGPVDMNQLVTEILLHSTMAASALSKPLRDHKKLCTAPSMAELRDKLSTIEGMALVLVGNGDKREFVIVAYGEIIQNSRIEISLAEVLDPAKREGLQLNPNEIQTIQTALEGSANYQQVLLADSLQARLLARLSDTVGPDHFNPSEELLRGDKPSDYMNAYVARVVTAIDAQDIKNSLQAPAGFSSTTDAPHVVEEFLGGDPGIVTHIPNPIGSLKNIQSLSNILQEQERLAIPGAEFLYTKHALQGDDVHLYAELVRSLNRLADQDKTEDEILSASEALIKNIYESLLTQFQGVHENAVEVAENAEEDAVHLAEAIREKSNSLKNMSGFNVMGKRWATQEIEEMRKKASDIVKTTKPQLDAAKAEIQTKASEAQAAIDQIIAETQKQLSFNSRKSKKPAIEAAANAAKAAINKEAKVKQKQVHGLFRPIKKAAEEVKAVVEKEMKPKK